MLMAGFVSLAPYGLGIGFQILWWSIVGKRQWGSEIRFLVDFLLPTTHLLSGPCRGIQVQNPCLPARGGLLLPVRNVISLYMKSSLVNHFNIDERVHLVVVGRPSCTVLRFGVGIGMFYTKAWARFYNGFVKSCFPPLQLPA